MNMIKSSYFKYTILFFCNLFFTICFTSCIKIDHPKKCPPGTFPDTVINMADINSVFNDYNTALNQYSGNSPIIFSSNRKSSGGQFDLEQAGFSFVFDQLNGSFSLGTAITDDAFINKLINQAKTPGNDFGPYRFFNSMDGFEYLTVASVNGIGNLDLYYLRNRPVFNTDIPDVEGPFPVKILNSSYDDAYICFDSNLDSAYFDSNRNGNFDIFLQNKPAKTELAAWFSSDYVNSTIVDSVNSFSNDECPFVYRKIMVFVSNRSGGFGGDDLYYAVFRKGKWSSPVNFGERINTSSNEYRPVLGYHPDFSNLFMIFSSNRPGGKGGFDLYFTGVEFPE
jgi:hypothetical protein